MSDCPITGDAEIKTIYGGLESGQAAPIGFQWIRTDPEIHVSIELLDSLDDKARTFLTATYELGEPCPHQELVIHARLRDTP